MSSNLQAALFLLGALPLAFVLLIGAQRLAQRFGARLDDAAAAPAGDAREDDFIRLVGFVTVLGAAGLFVFAGEWRVLFLPMRWFAVFIGLVGAWAMTFPARYRELRRRNRT